MFLKRIEMQGFKSFADRSVITFENDITGIVGPNGCGKSNISDAVRWVLGEQSAKSMRGSTMTDVIFAGTSNRKMVNFAEVVLVFDNTNRYLHTDYDEIEITRRLHRISGESEYLINRTPCRLKDIIDLILDSGLGRDSLSIISQGNISNFAEAKPIDRRGLFEEAAGVAKYKKRKHESTLRLNRTQDNLDRLSDIIDEIEKQVGPLKRQSTKALLYKSKKEKLEKIEIGVLVSEIENYQNKIQETEESLRQIEVSTVMHNAQMLTLENAIKELKDESKSLEREVQSLQEETLRIMQEIQTLEARKVEIDERRKYQIERSENEAKALEVKRLLEEAKFEYFDRKSRYERIQADLQMSNRALEELAEKMSNASNKLNDADNHTRRLENRKEVIRGQLQNPYQSQAGLQAVMKAKDSLYGVMETVVKAFKPNDGYEVAISTALGGALYNIITKDERSARGAIDFLKRNQSGRATFLPLNVMKPSYVRQDAKIVCDNTPGFLGVANEFVSYEHVYEPIALNLLGSVLVTDTLEHANELSARLHNQYKIVTLDGDVVHRGGSMTGGKQTSSQSIMLLEKEFQGMDTQIENARILQDKAYQDYRFIRKEYENLNENIVQLRIQFAQIEPVMEAKRSKYERLQADYEVLQPNDTNEDVSFTDELLESLNACYSRRDEITTKIRLKNDRRVKCSSELDRKENQFTQLRREMSSIQADERALQMDLVKSKTEYEFHVNRLNSEYQMTIEFAMSLDHDIDIASAKEEVKMLRKEIQDLGNVNMEAPAQYEEINNRYEHLKTQYDELVSSKQKILDAIAEMDEIMEKQFKETFDNINNELQGVFTVLFGGGKAKLFLEDPSDILNSGIDIDVQPPGKKVQNIRLFSGGEKALIAICVLFAILKVRPVPLCIFDEVEAALDQGNVERFAKYIREFEETTQFIVVTHRPGTMEQCDVLYGVTMPQQGVSQLLKVKLKDAIDLSEESEAQA